MNIKTLVDTGFEADYTLSQINEFDKIFTSDKILQDYIYRIHEDDNTLDMKRGEFYPEILRCIISLKRAFANAYKIAEGQCQPNFGSNGSIDTIMTAMKLREINRKIDPEKRGGMLVSTPTYFRNYNSAFAKQIKIIKVPLKMPKWEMDIDLFLEKLNTLYPTVVFLVTPNNPTGIPLTDEHIIKVIENAPDDTLIVMDRTLVNVENEIRTSELLLRFNNKQLVVLHSFSKYLGLSHLRIGCALYSNIDIAKEMQPHLPLGLGVEGAIKGTKYLKENGVLRPSDYVINNIRESKEILLSFCRQMPQFSMTDFTGNYCLLFMPPDVSSTKISYYLQNKGIYVMEGVDFPEPVDGMIRLHTGGKPEFMQRTVDALKDF